MTPPDSVRSDHSPLHPQLADGQSIKVIGLGGVGGILVRYLGLFLASLKRNVRLVLIDGDAFDPTTNATRMYFSTADNKAAVVRDELLAFLADSQLALVAIDEFVTHDNISRLIQPGDFVVLCVDNHHTRSLVDCYCSTLNDVFLLSGGNDGVGPDSSGVYRAGTFGNVQAYLRRNGHDLSRIYRNSTRKLLCPSTNIRATTRVALKCWHRRPKSCRRTCKPRRRCSTPFGSTPAAHCITRNSPSTLPKGRWDRSPCRRRNG